MKAAIQTGLAAVLALSMTAPAALAQYQPTAEYQRDMNRYENDRAAYDVRRGDYEAARRDYERRVSDYQAARAAYDNRYGYGSYTRRYGAAPVWDNARWAGYEAPAVDRYGRNVAYTSPSCVSNNNSAVTAGIIGALAGAALGSNVAANGRGTEGAVLGGVVGAGLGAAIGHSRDKYRCDTRGPYYSYNDTIAYREASGYRSDRYSYYTRQKCRLAAAPTNSRGEDYRYVRVCPDARGRYRITG